LPRFPKFTSIWTKGFLFIKSIPDPKIFNIINLPFYPGILKAEFLDIIDPLLILESLSDYKFRTDAESDIIDFSKANWKFPPFKD
jgi:hypothetical protein